MKKRIAALGLCLVLFAVSFCLGGCANPSAYTLISEADKKTAELDSYAVKITMNIDMTLSNETISIPETVSEIYASGMKGENPVMRMRSVTQSAEGENEVNMYVEGGNYYISMLGEKYQVPANSVTENMKVDDTLDSIMADIPQDLFEGIEIEKRAMGEKAVVILPSNSAFSEIYSDLLSDTASSLGGGDASVELSDAKIEIVVGEDGYISSEMVSFTMKLVMTAAATTMEVTAKARVSVQYIDPGSEVTVTAPEGYKDYQKLE